jgi:peptide/nickel transport system substrate-binding protein
MYEENAASRRRPVRWLACVLAVATLAAACGGDDGDDGTDEAGGTGGDVENTTTTTEALGEPVTGGAITVGLEAETNSWLPGQGSFATSGTNVGLAIYDPLMDRGEDGEMRPYLAESLTPNEDLTQYTLKLREGVTFHDGTALTADVIKTIFDEYLKAPTANTLGSLQNVTEVQVVDPLTAVYVLAEGSAAFPDLLQGSIGWPFSVEAAKAAGDQAGSQPVGTGPFKFESWQRDSALIVSKNEDYWREGLPYLDQITFRPIPDEDSRVQSLLSGDLQAMQSLRGSAVKQVLEAEEAGGITAYQYTGNTSGASIFNVLVPPLDDVRIRKAQVHSSDAEAVAEVLGDDGLVEPTTQYFSSDSPWYSQKVADAYPKYDIEAGKALVDEYKEDPNRSDGKSPGDPVTYDYNCLPDPSLLEVAQLVQAQLQLVGIEVTLNAVEQAAHVANAVGAASDPPFSGDYMVNCWRIGSQNDPATTYSLDFGDPETTAANVTNFYTPELAELVTQLQTTADFDERYAINEEIGLLLSENVPVSYGVGTATVIGTQDTVKNVAGWTLPDGTVGEGTPNAEVVWREVWLEQ